MLKKSNSLFKIVCSAYFACVCFSAHADVNSDLVRLESIQTLSEKDNQAALVQFKEFYAQLNAETNYLVRLETLRALSGAYIDAGDGKASELIKAEILKWAKLNGDKETIALADVDVAYKLRDMGKIAQAIAKLKEIEIAIKGSKQAENLMRLEIAFGQMYQTSSQYELALSHQLEALHLTDRLKQRQTISKIRRMDSLANLYYIMQNPEQALIMTSEALKLATQINSPRITSNLRQTQAMSLSLLHRYPESLVAYERSLQAAQEANLPKLEALILSNIADIHLRTHNFTKAESVARSALKKAVLIQDEPAINNAKANIGFALGGQGKIAQAMEYLQPILKVSRDSGDMADIEATVGEVGRMFENAKMYKEALEYTREQQKLGDELFRSDRAKTVATLQEQFDTDQRKKQIELLARENEVKDADIKNGKLRQVVTLLAALVTVMVGIFVYMLYRKVKQTNAKLEEVNQQLEFHSVRDPLTGLHNRRSFLEMMKVRTANVENDRREEDGSSPDCLMIMDIDHFKHVNDTWGHSAGDAVLVEVANRLRAAVRDTDMTLRWGGEEFLIYSPKTRPNQLTPMVERIMKSIGATPVTVGSTVIPVTVSAGFISLPFSGLPESVCDWEKAMQLADMALYMGKVNGRNRAYGLIRLLQHHEQALPLLEQDFSEAIKQGMVEVTVVLGPNADPAT